MELRIMQAARTAMEELGVSYMEVQTTIVSPDEKRAGTQANRYDAQIGDRTIVVYTIENEEAVHVVRIEVRRLP